MTGSQTDAPGAARARARAEWQALRDRLATITPAAVGRAVLATAVALVVGGLAVGTWPTLLPFALGALLAYAVLPVVDALDGILPRTVAAAVTMIGVVAVVVAVFVIVLPPLTNAIFLLAGQVPDNARIDELVAQLLQVLPEDSRATVSPILLTLADASKSALAGASGNLNDLVPTLLTAALGVVGAVLGLLVLPSWLLVVLSHKERARIALDARLGGWMRPDVWAAIRIFDRAAGQYVRGFLVVAILTGVATYVGLTLATRLGGPVFTAPLALATLAGAVQVVPAVGPILGLLPAALLLALDPQRALVYLIVYIVARWGVGTFVGGRTDVSRVRVHPAILIPGVIILSQLGPIWLLLSAPILAFSSDLVRYLHGRLSEPPRPAGLLPDEPLPSTVVVAPRPISPVYAAGRPGPLPYPTGSTAVAAGPQPAGPAAPR